MFTLQWYLFLMTYVGERPWWPIQSPNKRRKEESARLRGERDQIKFIDLGFERWKAARNLNNFSG